MENKKVFLVTSGEYDSYRVECAFDELELAEAWAAEMNKRRDDNYRLYEVEEVSLNPPLQSGQYVTAGYRAFRVFMDREGNSIWPSEPAVKETQRPFVRDAELCLRPTWNKQVMRWLVIAKDIEGATKIANEQRIRAIAEGRWGSDGECLVGSA